MKIPYKESVRKKFIANADFIGFLGKVILLFIMAIQGLVLIPASNVLSDIDDVSELRVSYAILSALESISDQELIPHEKQKEKAEIARELKSRLNFEKKAIYENSNNKSSLKIPNSKFIILTQSISIFGAALLFAPNLKKLLKKEKSANPSQRKKTSAKKPPQKR